MTNPTSNFGWQMPTSTDLVTDLPADFEVFGQAVDTSLADLKGGTSGQVLSKASNTDMDFTWVAQDDSNAIQNAIVDAKGDLIAATAADTPARLAVGTNGQVLTADSTAATGLKWAAAGGGLTLISATTIGTSVSSVTVSSAFSSTYDNYFITVNGGTSTANGNILIQLGSTTSGYLVAGNFMSYTSSTINGFATASNANWYAGKHSADDLMLETILHNPNLAKVTTYTARAVGNNGASGGITNYQGYLNNTTQYTAFTLIFDSACTGGTIRVYGYQNS
jgi:hypothetical protein